MGAGAGKAPDWEAVLAVVLVECVGSEALVADSDVEDEEDDDDDDDDDVKEDEEDVDVCSLAETPVKICSTIPLII